MLFKKDNSEACVNQLTQPTQASHRRKPTVDFVYYLVVDEINRGFPTMQASLSHCCYSSSEPNELDTIHLRLIEIHFIQMKGQAVLKEEK